jgi:DNA sulfur modification protein DndD
MKNFGPYKGIYELEFKKRDKRNIEIIWGTNGSGKTHVFKAVKWCLYGYDPSPKDKEPREASRKDAWECICGTNKEDQPPPDPYMYVYIWFEDTTRKETKRYLLKRSVRPRSSMAYIVNSTQIDIDCELTENGKTVYNAREKIESILPVAASQFFMFHGEDLRYMSQKHLEHTKKAIELILEAVTFRQGISDLTKIAKEIEKERDYEIRKVGDLSTIVKLKNDVAQKIEENEKDLEKGKEELESTGKGVVRIEEELRSRQKSRMTMSRLDELRKQKSQLEDDERKFLLRRDNLINQLPSIVILPEMIKILGKKQERHEKREKIREHILQLRGRLELADEISKLEECICGHEITEVERRFIKGQQMSIEKEMKKLKSELFEEDPTYYQLRETIASIKSGDPDFETLQKDIVDLNLRIDELDSQIKKVEGHLSGIEEEKIRELAKERDELKKKEGEIEERMRTIERDKKDNEQKKERFIKLIKQREKAYSISTALDDQLDMTSKCIEAFEFVVARLSTLRKEQIMEYSTYFFNGLTNKPEEFEKIQIDDDYNVQVIDSKGNIIYRPGLSTGEREIVALSFILGLKNASEKVAPLILDTFFVHLDESHYSNIIRELPKFADQVILMLTDLEYKNLKERAPESFFESVNHVWKTNRIQAEERSELMLTQEVALHA